MIVTLDGQQVGDSFDSEQTLQSVLDHVTDQHLDERMIVFVSADGETLVDDALNTRLQQPLQDTQKLDLVSANPRTLVAEALREVAKNLEATGEAQAAVAEQLQAGETAAGIKGFAQFLRACQICQHTLRESNRVLQTDLAEFTACGQQVHEHVEALNHRLRELRDAFESRDMVLLGDIVQYELPDLCRTWRDILSELAETIANNTQPA